MADVRAGRRRGAARVTDGRCITGGRSSGLPGRVHGPVAGRAAWRWRSIAVGTATPADADGVADSACIVLVRFRCASTPCRRRAARRRRAAPVRDHGAAQGQQEGAFEPLGPRTSARSARARRLGIGAAEPAREQPLHGADRVEVPLGRANRRALRPTRIRFTQRSVGHRRDLAVVPCPARRSPQMAAADGAVDGHGVGRVRTSRPTRALHPRDRRRWPTSLVSSLSPRPRRSRGDRDHELPIALLERPIVRPSRGSSARRDRAARRGVERRVVRRAHARATWPRRVPVLWIRARPPRSVQRAVQRPVRPRPTTVRSTPDGGGGEVTEGRTRAEVRVGRAVPRRKVNWSLPP